MDCVKCTRSLPSDGRLLSCVVCKNGYHLGKACSGVADSTFSGMSAAKRESWKCLTCRTGEIRSDSGTGVNVTLNESLQAVGHQAPEVADVSVGNQLAAIRAALKELLSLKSSVATLLPLPAKVDQLLALGPVVD